MRPSTIFALALGVVLGTTDATSAGDTSCASLDIHVKGDAVKGDQSCNDGQFGGIGRDGIGLTEALKVKGAGFVMFLYHVEAGVRTYLNQVDFEDLILDSSNFERLDSIKVHAASKGYSVRKFLGVVKADNRSYPCFGLARYSGHVFSGYRHMVYGFYCEFVGDEVDAARVDEVMAAIDTDF